jgi:hypothetical protein
MQIIALSLGMNLSDLCPNNACMLALIVCKYNPEIKQLPALIKVFPEHFRRYGAALLNSQNATKEPAAVV